MTSKHYGWQARWQVDLATCTATHDSGLTFRFSQTEPGIWDGSAINAQEWAIEAGKRMNPSDLQRHAVRLAREAGDSYKAALDRRQ